jgi:metal-responsive CopG/Arc/MetJ family transcriptional regulator
MPRLSVTVDEKFLQRLNKARDWAGKKTQEQFIKMAIENEIKPFEEQLDELERAEEKIRKKLPLLKRPHGNARVRE